MSRTIKIIFAGLFFVCLSHGGYAAVRSISDTEYSFSPLRSPAPAAAPGSRAGCEFEACPAAYTTSTPTCYYNGGHSGCVRVSCCNDDEVVEVLECPGTDVLGFRTDSTEDIANLSSLEYCDGYRNGVHAIYLAEDPSQCSIQGITEITYLAGLLYSSDCGSSVNVVQKTCVRASDGGTVKYCLLTDTTGYEACPADDSTYSPYPHSDCGAHSDETAIPCYRPCGDSRTCVGYTCKTDNLKPCASLELIKIGEGFYSSGVSDTYDELKSITHQCMGTDGHVKYMGFYCKNLYTQEDCTALNGTTSNECTIHLASGGTSSAYSCGCGSSYRTLEKFCADEHPTDADCALNYYGTGATCLLDKDEGGTTLTKYSTFDNSIPLCSSFDTEWKWVEKTESSCPSFEGETAPDEKECRKLEDGTFTNIHVCRYCHNYMDEDETSARTTCGVAEPVACHYKDDSVVYMGCSCEATGLKTLETLCTENGDPNCTNQAVGAGSECHTDEGAADDVVYYEKITCHPSFMEKEAWCTANPDKILEGYSCDDYKGFGDACKLDADDPSDSSQYKYVNYQLSCPAEGDSRLADNKNDCLLEGESRVAYDTCFDYTENKEKYICKCPNGYGLECDDAYKIRGGTVCTFDRSKSTGLTLTKYKHCQVSCGHSYATSYSETAYGCEDVDTYISTIRGGLENPEKCTMSGDRKEFFICGCPRNFKTIDEWCAANYVEEGLSSVTDCTTNYTGRGRECVRDIETDEEGNPSRVLSKYAYYVRYCPATRPLYYSEEDCRYIGGEYDYSCVDSSSNERVVCQCPTGWYLTNGSNASGTCSTQTLSEKTFNAEASGNYCDFDGSDSRRYERCVAKCDDAMSELAVDGAFTYLSSDNMTPTQNQCATKMGNGAVLGYGGQAYCSLNHTLMYPCYCPKGMVECSAENNQVAADGASICSINGKTYYSACQLMNCPKESPTIAIVDKDTDVSATFGDGAISSPCSQDGEDKLQVMCDASSYKDPCDYPYEAPKDGTWCKYGDGTTLMKDGRKHYKSGACRVKKELGVCGTSISGAPEGSSYTIFVASSEGECQAQYGPGIKTQLCEYGAEQGYKRAYNCYYDATEFKYTTANCGVRHDLTGNYIIVNGQKKWNECKCASAYQHHKFNCGGLLSGNPCQQEISQSMIDKDASLKDAVEDGYELKGKVLPFYPYCQCSADYTEICDEDGSGRYKGVGMACNGKYTSCECVPDKLPDNWTDNYYGCPGGKKPTGVWKDNGCGKKYYQCTVVECTWEYTEMCEAPLIPVGQSCQDNEGNIGGYKACTCPSEYKTCPAGQVGEGEPCNLKGISYYKSCKSQETCSSLANETCTGPLQIGVNPCIRDDITYYESCVCANGYSKVCGEGEVGVGNYCEIDGVKYFKECTKPEKNECTAGHVVACDTNQESYSPCVGVDDNGKQVVKYLCKCPSNWSTCGGSAPGAIDGVAIEKCVQTASDGSQTTYYSECNTEAETCSPYQELTYKVCTSAQVGEGGHCLSQTTTTTSLTGDDGETVMENGITYKVKYASCKDSNDCLTNGFRYSCSGYDPSGLGEFCVDSNGNKLYRSCPCPSSYTSCSNPNASKGNKCIPLLENGSFGQTLYSSCACDRSKYKYTCATEGYNKGIKAPNTSNYCEVEEPVTTTTTDEDGNTVSETSIKSVKYYTSCDCDEKYKYTCSDRDHGEIIPEGYDEDYCLINSTKFYKGCDCSSEYAVTADDCPSSEGQTVDSVRGSCTIKGTIAHTSIDPSTGSSVTSTITNKTLYKNCICKPNYILDCLDPNYDQTNVPACTLNEANHKYPKCKCSEDKTCKPSGRNTGIIGDASTICTEITADSFGSRTEEAKYTSCTCKEEFKYISASQCSSDVYDQSSEEYCDDGEGNEKYYKKCNCNPLLFDNSVVASTNNATTYCSSLGQTVLFDEDTGTQFCMEMLYDSSAAGHVVTKYHPSRNLCCSSTLSGYTQITTSSYATLSDFYFAYGEGTLRRYVKSRCGHEANAIIELNCDGTPYYKCSNTSVTPSNTWYTKEECSDLDRNETALLVTSGTKQTISISWLGEGVDVYPGCGCPSNYSKTVSCTQNITQLQNYITSGVDAPICFDYAHHYDDGWWMSKTSNAGCSFKTDGEKCIDANGTTIKYDWSKCSCDKSVYTNVSTKGELDDCSRDTSHSYFCTFCIDAKGGIYRTSASGNGGKGTTNDNGGFKVNGTMSICGYRSGKAKCWK